jgi:hypothetical protein
MLCRTGLSLPLPDCGGQYHHPLAARPLWKWRSVHRHRLLVRHWFIKRLLLWRGGSTAVPPCSMRPLLNCLLESPRFVIRCAQVWRVGLVPARLLFCSKQLRVVCCKSWQLLSTVYVTLSWCKCATLIDSRMIRKCAMVRLFEFVMLCLIFPV